ncbi:MAG TPA: NrfD/PsrC family molybdoenzyme membrane anchor subunit, partial [Nannocystis sp.]
MAGDVLGRQWVTGGHDIASVNDAIAGKVMSRPHRRTWGIALLVAAIGVTMLVISVAVLFVQGIGVWGVDVPVAWGVAIVSFVWWVGIGHAGTLISAILLLAKQPWRQSINRFAEAMTLFAILCAAMYPLLHLGRPLFFYWLVPYPNTYGVWPQFLSPLVWDFFAIFTYFTVSVVFWYIGLIPDLATMRDRSTGRRARIYGVLALGWRGAARHWERYQTAYLLLAGLATTLVVSVHTIVSFDFAVSQLPGWHLTMFPPYFVAGAIFSGFAMVLTLIIPVRAWLGFKDFVTDDHLDACAKLMLTSGLIVGYGYAAELFFGWHSGDPQDRSLIESHLRGHSAPLFWTIIALNVAAIQTLWFRTARRSVAWLFVLSILVNVGMWLERYLIVISTLEHGMLLPTTEGHYVPTVWDWGTFIGTLGFFSFFMLLFL